MSHLIVRSGSVSDLRREDPSLRVVKMTAKELAAYIDHTLLKADATAQDIDRLCEEAKQHHFHSVCVNSSRVGRAYAILEDTDIKVAATIGFPLGAMDTDAKRYEIEAAIDLGASELDVVINLGWIKDGDDRAILREIRDLVEAADGVPLKVILETGFLSREEIMQCCALVVEGGAQYVKTSTGFGPGGATLEHVRWMREAVGPKFGVKASGGIKDTATALAMIEAGATRIGTSSGIALVQGLKSES